MLHKPGYTDSELLDELKFGNPQDDAIRFIYRSFYRGCESYVVNNSGREDDARDIFQEVVLSFIELVTAGKFRGECSVSTFLYTLTRHAWLNEMKRKGRAKLREEKFEGNQERVIVDFSHLIESNETKKQLLKLVEQLGETCKKILTAFYYDSLPMKEILKKLDYENEQVVRNKKYKCLKQLEQTVSADKQLIKNLKSANWYE